MFIIRFLSDHQMSRAHVQQLANYVICDILP